MSNIKFIPRIINNKKNTPLYLIFFITSRCNMRCKHCFFWKERNNFSELSLYEIEKTSKSLDNLLFLRLTGGEPFLRTDLPEIVNIFYKNNSLRNLGINTNGFFTKRIVEDVKKILENNEINLDVCVSIDDIEKEHDENRQIKGAFSHAIETLTELNKLKKQYKNLTTTVGLTVFSKNQNRLNFIFNEIKKVNPTFISANLVRGNPQSEELKNVNIRLYLDFFNKIMKYNKKSNNFYFNTQFKDKLLSKKVSKTFVEKRYQGINCVAGDKVAVIYSNGDIFPCELLNKKIGNLKDYNFNFKKLWNSNKRKEIMRFIRKSKCFCTHECFLTSSMLLEPINLLKCLFKR